MLHSREVPCEPISVFLRWSLNATHRFRGTCPFCIRNDYKSCWSPAWFCHWRSQSYQFAAYQPTLAFMLSLSILPPVYWFFSFSVHMFKFFLPLIIILPLSAIESTWLYLHILFETLKFGFSPEIWLLSWNLASSPFPSLPFPSCTGYQAESLIHAEHML